MKRNNFEIVSMTQIPHTYFLQGVLKQLNGRECFLDTDNDLNETIYSGDIFEAILSEQEEMKGIILEEKNKDVLEQLEYLAKNISTEYVQIIKI